MTAFRYSNSEYKTPPIAFCLRGAKTDSVLFKSYSPLRKNMIHYIKCAFSPKKFWNM